MARDSIEKKPLSETEHRSQHMNVSSPKGPVDTYQASENQKLPPAHVIKVGNTYGYQEQRDSIDPIPLGEGTNIRTSRKRED